MNIEPPSLLLPLTAIAFFSIAMTGYIIIHHKSLPKIKFSSLIILGGAIWLIFSALEMSTPFILEKTLFKKMQYIGILIIPSLWFMMCSARAV
ncbi:histidine kinase N-terminal 7TM domain-containing protein [[Eubacterium] cellulosolvens]